MWFKYLADEAFSPNSEPWLDSESNDESSDLGVVESSVVDHSKEDQNVGWYEQLHARYSSSRRMRHLFFEEHMQVIGDSRYIRFYRQQRNYESRSISRPTVTNSVQQTPTPTVYGQTSTHTPQH